MLKLNSVHVHNIILADDNQNLENIASAPKAPPKADVYTHMAHNSQLSFYHMHDGLIPANFKVRHACTHNHTHFHRLII